MIVNTAPVQTWTRLMNIPNRGTRRNGESLLWCLLALSLWTAACGDDPGPGGATQDPQVPGPTTGAEIPSDEPSISVGTVVEYGHPIEYGIPEFGLGWGEPTTVAFGPSEHPSCPEGRLLFSSGRQVLSTNLSGDMIDPNNPAWKATFTETFQPEPILDQHIVKLKNGDVLFTHLGTTWNDNISPHPSWWDSTVEYPVKGEARPGGRAMCWVWRSSDCGSTWTQLSGLDAAKIPPPQGEPSGLYGTPRMKRTDPSKENPLTPEECDSDPKNCLKYASSGGWDGHFTYADPFSGDVFLATSCNYGNGQVNGSQHITSFVFRSTDNGESWSIVGELPGRQVFRAPLTSLASGVAAFAFRGSGGFAKVATLSPPFIKADLSNGLSVVKLPTGHKKAGAEIYNIWSTLTLARVTGDYPGFMLSTPYWEGGGSTLIHRTWRIFADGSAPPQEIGDLVKEPTGGDTLWGTFIEGTKGSNLAVFYWVERIPITNVKKDMDEDGVSPQEFRVKFQAFQECEQMLDAPGDLTVKNGQPYAWPYKTGGFPGDYMGGASYRVVKKQGVEHRFVATWTEEGCLRFNTIIINVPFKKLKPKFRLEETRPPKIILPGDVKPGDNVGDASDAGLAEATPGAK